MTINNISPAFSVWVEKCTQKMKDMGRNVRESLITEHNLGPATPVTLHESESRERGGSGATLFAQFIREIVHDSQRTRESATRFVHTKSIIRMHNIRCIFHMEYKRQRC